MGESFRYWCYRVYDGCKFINIFNNFGKDLKSSLVTHYYMLKFNINFFKLIYHIPSKFHFVMSYVWKVKVVFDVVKTTPTPGI